MLTPLENRCAENGQFSFTFGSIFEHHVVTASTLLFKLENFVSEAVQVMKAISTNRSQTRVIFSMQDRLRSLLAAILSQGLNKGIDEICRDDLDIPLSSVSVGMLR